MPIEIFVLKNRPEGFGTCVVIVQLVLSIKEAI